MTKARKARPKASNEEWNDSDAVNGFMKLLDHPLKAELEALRAIILTADRRVTEGIKWNSPSFYCNGWFATLNTRGTVILLILHRGAKVKDNSTPAMKIDDPLGVLEWLAKERCIARFSSAEDIKAKQKSLAAIIRQWTAQMKPGLEKS